MEHPDGSGLQGTIKKVSFVVSSFFFMGLVPYAPGTAGSLGGLAVYLLVRHDTRAHLAALIVIFAAGMLSSGRTERSLKKEDPRVIVIDEACGMLAALLYVPYNWVIAIWGFIIFRILDIIKPPPARALEQRGGSLGIMGDDLIAALYTNLILRVISYIFLK